MSQKNILYMTDFYFAHTIDYAADDLYLSSMLIDTYNIAFVNPTQWRAFIDSADLVLIRNCGNMALFQNEWDSFKKYAQQHNIKTFNSLDAKGDMLGKQYLIQLTQEGYPVIPTIDQASQLMQLPSSNQYVIKPKVGGNASGFQISDLKTIQSTSLENAVVQPFIPLQYEVSFYFVNNKYHHALYTGKSNNRWMLEPYLASHNDITFAQQFVDWNTMQHGIQRIDACLTHDGTLLLMEIEDFAPFMSFDRLDQHVKHSFVKHITQALHEALS